MSKITKANIEIENYCNNAHVTNNKKNLTMTLTKTCTCSCMPDKNRGKDTLYS